MHNTTDHAAAGGSAYRLSDEASGERTVRSGRASASSGPATQGDMRPAWITHPGRIEFAAEVRAAQHGRPYPTDAAVIC